jgi:hypothetical protein
MSPSWIAREQRRHNLATFRHQPPRKHPPVIALDRQLEIALQALNPKEK